MTFLVVLEQSQPGRAFGQQNERSDLERVPSAAMKTFSSIWHIVTVRLLHCLTNQTKSIRKPE
jgi:hypothetical protein